MHIATFATTAVVALTAGALTASPFAWASPATAVPAAGAATATAAAAAATGTATVTVPEKVDVGKQVLVEVQVQPAGVRDVQLQVGGTNNSYATVATGRTDSSGAAKIAWLPLTGGTYRVRAVVAGGDGADAVGPGAKVTAGYPFAEPPAEQLNPLTPGRVTIAKRAEGVNKVGKFRVRVRRSGGARVQITDAGGRVAWASDPGAAFAAASRSKTDWVNRSEAGAWWPVVNRSIVLTDQSVSGVRKKGDRLLITGTLKGKGGSADYTVTLSQERSGKTHSILMALKVARTSGGERLNSVQITSGRGADATVHGLGEQYRPFDLSGQVIPVLVQEQGVSRGELPGATLIDKATWGAGNLDTTYGAWPTYVTGQNRSFELVDDLRGGAFSIADMTRPREVSLESFQSRMTARLVAADNPKALMRARADGASRPELTDWVQRGAVLGLQGGTEFVKEKVAQMQAAGTKVSGVWLQDWVGRRTTKFGEQLWWTWQLNPKRYPGWSKMVADFDKQGIKVLTYINPFVINEDVATDKQADGTVVSFPVKNYYREGEQKGYLVKNRYGGTYVIQTIGFPTALVDLTNPDARDWFADIIAKNVLGVGAKGFMADFGEYLPMDGVLHEGTGLQQHNRYPALWAQTVKEGCKRGGVPDCMAFFRSSYLGTPKSAPLMWAGDQMVDYAVEDGLMSAVKGMLAGGVSGAPLWHSDVGGYTSVNAGVQDFIRSPQLNARWAEMQAFGVIMRSHETNRPRKNQQIYDTPETRSQFARASKIYSALYRYRKTVIDEAVRTGVPAMRHAWLVYPNSRAAGQDLQFFLGDKLFVAPVYSEGATSVSVTFPPGKWRHILTGKVYSGKALVPAPIGTPAAFVKDGDAEGKRIIADMKKAGLTG